MRFKGRITKGLLVALILTLIPITAFSAQKITPGSTCKVLNQKVVYQNKVYTCIKSGKKLVWNKGVIEKKPTPTPTPTPTHLPTSFEDLYEKRDGIAYAAWKSSSTAFASGTSKKVKYIQLVGPNTILPGNATPKLALELTSRVFSKYEIPEKIYFIQYSVNDKQWAKKQFQEILDSIQYKDFGDSAYISLLIEQNCRPTDCGGALQVGTNSGIAFVLQGVSKTIQNNSVIGHDYLISHEFFHALQRMTIIGKSMKEWPTSWIFEGSAQLAQNLAISGNSYEDYLAFRKSDSMNLYGKNSKIDKSFMSSYLDLNSNQDYFRSVDQYYAYNLGSRIMEILVALKGPGVLLDLYRETALMGFESGFESAIGVSWQIAAPIINKTIVQQFQDGM